MSQEYAELGEELSYLGSLNDYDTFKYELAKAFESDRLELLVPKLDWINQRIKEQQLTKKCIEKRIIEKINSKEFGSESVQVAGYEVTITRPREYGIDVEEYEVCKPRIREEFNPVKETTKYAVVNKIVDSLYKYGSEEDIALFNQYARQLERSTRVEIKSK